MREFNHGRGKYRRDTGVHGVSTMLQDAHPRFD
jgi:hypothetical protein